MEEKFTLPTETVELPSKGLLYSKDSELAKGTVEIKYMTAKEEDILTNQAYIKSGIVLDKLLKSLIVSKVEYDDLLIGDKNAILVAARILGYGKDYNITFGGNEYNVDLTQIQNKEVDFSLFKRGTNEFAFTLPQTGNNITFKIIKLKMQKYVTKNENFEEKYGEPKLYKNGVEVIKASANSIPLK
jgi:hypothetical protein